MSSSEPLEPVAFLTIENGDDLIVSFAIELADPGDVASLTLLRTPKYDFLLPGEERGVSVSHGLHPEVEDDLLERIRVTDSRVEIETTSRRYSLDVSRVDPAELRHARKVLQRMNFDRRFELQLA